MNAGRDRAAKVIPVLGDGIEYQAGAQVYDDDRRWAVAVQRGHHIGHAVRAHVSRAVIQNAHAGLCPGANHQRLHPQVLLHQRLEHRRQVRHDADQRGVPDVFHLDALHVQQAQEDHRVLVRQPLVLRRDAPRHAELLAFEQSDRDRRVSYIDYQQHAICRCAFVRAPKLYRSSARLPGLTQHSPQPQIHSTEHDAWDSGGNSVDFVGEVVIKGLIRTPCHVLCSPSPGARPACGSRRGLLRH